MIQLEFWCAGVAPELLPVFIRAAPSKITQVVVPRIGELVKPWSDCELESKVHAIRHVVDKDLIIVEFCPDFTGEWRNEVLRREDGLPAWMRRRPEQRERDPTPEELADTAAFNERMGFSR